MDQSTINTIVAIGGVYAIGRGVVETIQFIQRRVPSNLSLGLGLSSSQSNRKSNGDLVKAFQDSKRQADIRELLTNMAENLSHLEYAQLKLQDDLRREMNELRRAVLATKPTNTGY